MYTLKQNDLRIKTCTTYNSQMYSTKTQSNNQYNMILSGRQQVSKHNLVICHNKQQLLEVQNDFRISNSSLLN